MLLVLSKRVTADLEPSLGHRYLLRSPFDRTISRLSYKASLFQMKLDCESVEELLAAQVDELTFEECCLRRAEELLRLDKDIYYVSWSGGIDSTCLLVAMLRTWSAADLKRVVIRMTHRSIKENKHFFDKFVTQFPLENAAICASEELLKGNRLMLTGELGDQLFGSDMLLPASKQLGDEIIDGPYQETIPKIFDIWLAPNRGGREVLRHFRPIVDESPIPIRTAHDFLWWFNFSQKWQHVKYRFYEDANWNLKARYGQSVQHFFDSLEFQKWSLNNHDKKIRGTWQSYKFPAKRFIYEFSKQEEDLALEKVQSLASVYAYTRKRVAITENFEVVESAEELLKYARSRN